MKLSLVLLCGAASAASIARNEALEKITELNSVPRFFNQRSTALVQKIFARADKPAAGTGPFGLPASFEWKAPPNAPPSKVEAVQKGKGVAFPRAISKKIRYGPYRLPPTSEKTVQSTTMKANGMTDAFVLDAAKPCDACVLAVVNADLEYADGSKANVTTGAWLHHTVLLNSGPGVTDTNCQKSTTESIFESGNERTMIPLSLGDEFSVKTGYKIKPQDKFIVINEFQNQKDKEQYVWLTLTYEYFDGPREDMKSTKILWLSLGPNICNPSQPNPFGASNLTAMGQPKEQIFTEASIPWISPYEGILVGTGGHLHDGGTHLRIFQNDEEICDAEPEYGEKDADGANHITMMGACANLTPFKVGDKFHLQADYDFNVHSGQENNMGEMDGIMGISAVLLAV